MLELNQIRTRCWINPSSFFASEKSQAFGIEKFLNQSPELFGHLTVPHAIHRVLPHKLTHVKQEVKHYVQIICNDCVI